MASDLPPHHCGRAPRPRASRPREDADHTCSRSSGVYTAHGGRETRALTMAPSLSLLLASEAATPPPPLASWEAGGKQELQPAVSVVACTSLPGTPLAHPRGDQADSASAEATHAKRLFFSEASHNTPIHDLLAPHQESRALEKAQALIEEQQRRIETLTEKVLHYQHTRGEGQQRLQAELQDYIQENQRLRLQLDSLRAEVAALEQVRARDEHEVQQVVEALSAAEKGIAERDQLIKTLKNQDRLAENERLKEEQQRLLRRLDKLQKLTGVTGEEEFDSRSPEDVASQLARVQRDVALHRGMTRQLGHTTEVRQLAAAARLQKQLEEQQQQQRMQTAAGSNSGTWELRISKMCLVEAESNLLEGQKLIEEQRAEIQRLYKIGRGSRGLEYGKAGTDDREDRVSMALMQQKMMEEQQGLLKRLIEGMDRMAERGPDKGEGYRGDGTYFYSGTVLHACIETPDQDADYREKLMAVKEGVLLLFYDPKARIIFLLSFMPLDEDPVAILRPHKVLRLEMDPSTLLVTIGYEPCPGRTETHFFRLATEDELNSNNNQEQEQQHQQKAKEAPNHSNSSSSSSSCCCCCNNNSNNNSSSNSNSSNSGSSSSMSTNKIQPFLVLIVCRYRWHHALAYAGFIRIGPVIQQPSVIPSIQLSSEPPSTPREEMVVSVSVPGAIGFDGAPTTPERHNAYATTSTSLSTLANPAAAVFVAARFVAPAAAAFAADSLAAAFVVAAADAAAFLAASAAASAKLLGVAGSGSYHRAPPKREAPPPAPPPPPPPVEAKPKAPTPPQQSPRQGDENDLFVIRDGNLMLFEKAGDEQPILKLHNSDCVTQADAGSREFVITHKPGTPEEETYVFSFPTDEVYQGWYKKLEENGFLKRKGDQLGRTANQVGVVSKGCLELYKDYGAPDARPVIVLMADRCSAKASRERREIRILHTSPTGKRERITLDCASLAEFDRWDVALHFGNFLKGEGVAGKGSQTYANLSKYVFPINLFEDASGRKSALLIENRTILLFATPDATEPILSASADDCEVQPVISQRKLRVYINRNTKREQRVDFILALAKDFDRYAAACQRDSFPEAVVGRPVEKLAIPFVLCRKGLMAVYKSKFHAHAELTLEVTKYTLTEDGPVYVFISNDSKGTARRVTVTSPDSRTRWEFAIKLAGFKSFSKTPPPRFFFPQIIYGFVAEEASELRKDSFLGSARAAFGRLQMPRDKAHAGDSGAESPKSPKQ
ncbi:hypothetical protein Emed_005274 [Eimeria media]